MSDDTLFFSQNSTNRIFANRLGTVREFSQRFIVEKLIFNSLASCSWVIPSCFRISFMISPNISQYTSAFLYYSTCYSIFKHICRNKEKICVETNFNVQTDSSFIISSTKKATCSLDVYQSAGRFFMLAIFLQ